MRPHISRDETNAATLEWWSDDKKITMYPMSGVLLKVWGKDVGDEMEEVSLADADAVQRAFDWLWTPVAPGHISRELMDKFHAAMSEVLDMQARGEPMKFVQL